MSIYLSWRFLKGQRLGPYGNRGPHCLGRVIVEGYLVFSHIDGSCLGMLVRRAEIPTVIVPRVTIESDAPTGRGGIEAAIRNLFCIPILTHQNIEDIKDELRSRFSGDVVEQAVADMERGGILEQVCVGNYRKVV